MPKAPQISQYNTLEVLDDTPALEYTFTEYLKPGTAVGELSVNDNDDPFVNVNEMGDRDQEQEQEPDQDQDYPEVHEDSGNNSTAGQSLGLSSPLSTNERTKNLYSKIIENQNTKIENLTKLVSNNSEEVIELVRLLSSANSKIRKFEEQIEILNGEKYELSKKEGILRDQIEGLFSQIGDLKEENRQLKELGRSSSKKEEEKEKEESYSKSSISIERQMYLSEKSEDSVDPPSDNQLYVHRGRDVKKLGVEWPPK